MGNIIPNYFYPLKYYLAKKVVRAAQKNSRNARENRIEPEVIFSTQKSYHFQTFSGCDQNGNSLQLKLVLRPSKLAEVVLILKLANGSIYTFPDVERVNIINVKDYKWKIKGLVIENLEPYRRARVVFNGLLRDLSVKDYEKVEHVQFSFIFHCCSSPRFYPEDCDSRLLTEALATRPWRDSSWKKFLKDHPDGFEQFGSLLGYIKGANFPEELVMNLAACRTRYEGSGDTFLVDKELKVFLAEANGVLVHLTLQSFQDQKSQLTYGHIFHKDLRTEAITAQDVRINDVAPSRGIPDFFTAHISAPSDEYIVSFHTSKTSIVFQTSETGYEVGNAFAECNVNSSRGKALIEIQYYDPKKLNLPKLKPVLCEKKVDVRPDDYVLNIKSEDAQILDLTGGKGNSLALLSSLNSKDFLVPDGFIVTVNAFNRQIAEIKLLEDAIRNIEKAFYGHSDAKREEVCELAVRLFTNEPVHSDLSNEILSNLKDVIRSSSTDAIDVVSWAVRSSAIGEDSEELSAAGQNETILGCVTESEVLKAVSKCWASLFTYQSVQYRWQHGLPVKSQMAVVVQKMVPADVAGVLFTWHPTTSNPSQMIVTSNFGLGESVVSGKSDPDTFVLHRTFNGEMTLENQSIGQKNKVFTLTEKGVTEVSTADNAEGSFVFINGKDVKQSWSLTKDQVLNLGKVGILLEQAFGSPRDIEWAYYKGVLYLLQSRPITTLSTWTDFELTHELDSAIVTDNSLFTIANTGEVFPAAVSALSRTSVLEELDRGMQANLQSRNVEDAFMRGVSTVSNRVFIDCIFVLYAHHAFDEIQMSAKIVDLAVFGHPVVNDRIIQMAAGRFGKTSPITGVKILGTMWSNSGKLDKVVQSSKDFSKSANYGIQDGDNALEIYRKIQSNNLLKLVSYNHSLTSQVSVFWQIVCMMTLIGREKEIKTENFTDFANILSSCEGVESAEVPFYLQKIAEIVRDEGYAEEFCTIKPEFGVDWLRAKCPAAFKVFTEFLEKHGHRCIGEFDLINEAWDLKPCQVIVMLQANVKHMQQNNKVEKSVSQVISELVSPINAVGRALLRYSLTKLRAAVGKREQTKSSFVLAIHKLRLAYRKLAKAMVQEGLLPSESLIFHLTTYELGEVLKGRNPGLITKAIRRRKLHPKWSSLRFPELNYGFPHPEPECEIPLELVPGTKCVGTPVCVGNVQARACVITNLNEIGTLQKGDILITYCTDIGWSPYFPMLGGVVTEIGGLVSHGAVVAREYGLPCIVGVKNATKLFKTGDTVALSGKTGELGKV